MAGKKLIEPVIVSDYEDDVEAFFADCKSSGVLDAIINAILECYLNLPEIPDPAHNPLSLACVCKQQQQDPQLFALHVKYPETRGINHWMNI
jgi:hypothetical protein